MKKHAELYVVEEKAYNFKLRTQNAGGTKERGGT